MKRKFTQGDEGYRHYKVSVGKELKRINKNWDCFLRFFSSVFFALHGNREIPPLKNPNPNPWAFSVSGVAIDTQRCIVDWLTESLMLTCINERLLESYYKKLVPLIDLCSSSYPRIRIQKYLKPQPNITARPPRYSLTAEILTPQHTTALCT